MNSLGERVNHYLLIAIIVAFIAGLIVQRFFVLPPLSTLFFSFILFTVALLNQKKTPTLSTMLLLFGIVSLACLYSVNNKNSSISSTNINSRILTEEDTVLIGILTAMPLFDGERSTVIIKAQQLRLKQEPYFTKVQGLVQLRLKEQWPASLVPGDSLVIRTKLSRPYSFSNPGSFDYPQFLDAKNINIIGRISSTVHILKLQTEQSWFLKLRYLPENLRLSIREYLNKTLEPKEAGIYRALLLGDRSGLNKDTLEAFKASGVVHILAISGLHITLVTSLFFFIIYWLIRRSQYLLLHISCKKVALLASIPPIWIYALLAGSQTPVMRSLIMVIIFIVAYCINRHRSPFTTLSSAALFILLLNPASLFTVSFQLSFAAVAALILILPRLQQLTQTSVEPSEKPPSIATRFTGWIIAAFLVSIAATIGTAPLLLQSFNRISVVGPVANLIIEPLLCLWSLPLGLLAIVIHLCDFEVASHILHLGAYGIKAAMQVTTFFSNSNLSTLWLPTPPTSLIILYYLAIGLCFSKISSKKTLPLFFVISILFIVSPQYIIHRFSSLSEIVFLDVGQGSSTVITFPGGKRVLVDGGGASSAKFNVGESIIARYLWHKGITRLESIVITHPDADHYNGIPFLLKRFRPHILWTNGESGHDQEYEDLITLAYELGIDVKKPMGNETLLKEGGVTLSNIPNPYLDNTFTSGMTLQSNEQSLIVRVAGDKETCLFPGDISRKVEQTLIEEKASLQSSILLSPHHGSKTSNSEAFLAAVNPEVIIVSAGRFKPLLFPSDKLRKHTKRNNIPLLITAQEGAITFQLNDGEHFPFLHKK